MISSSSTCSAFRSASANPHRARLRCGGTSFRVLAFAAPHAASPLAGAIAGASLSRSSSSLAGTTLLPGSTSVVRCGAVAAPVSHSASPLGVDGSRSSGSLGGHFVCSGSASVASRVRRHSSVGGGCSVGRIGAHFGASAGSRSLGSLGGRFVCSGSASVASRVRRHSSVGGGCSVAGASRSQRTTDVLTSLRLESVLTHD